MSIDYNQIITIMTSVLASLGGSAALTKIIADYIGKRQLESIKQEHKKEIETLKQEHSKEIEAYKVQLEVIKETSLRYSTEQFNIYNKLWTTLCNLRVATDNLWARANEENLGTFSKLLEDASIEIEMSSLLVEEKHYLEMKEVLSELGRYRLGKIKIIDIHKNPANLQNQDVFLELGGWVHNNRQSKERFEGILEEIRKELKQQIRGTLNA